MIWYTEKMQDEQQRVKSDTFYRHRALGRLAIASIGVLVLIYLGIYMVRSGTYQKLSALETIAGHIAAQEVAGNFSAPQPLVVSRASGTVPGGLGGSYTLTRTGVIQQTNLQRQGNGNLPPLAENSTLDDIAQIRLDDMFAKQYFAHVSPASSSAITVAQAIGYQYIALGENLALGNFNGDQDVVTAWMNSPGHRANILNGTYTQIGVAVGEGNFQGNDVWIAVQVFGKPTSDCPLPETSLKDQIDAEEQEAGAMQAQVASEQSQLDQSNSAQVASYNQLVDQYDNLLAQIKSDIAEYNDQIAAYNQCAGLGSSTNSQ